MAKVISREEFMDICPVDLKKRIDDFIVYYLEKKKTSFSNIVESNKKNDFRDNKNQKKKQSNVYFKKPFEKDMNELQKILVDYRGILSKLNETNIDIVWKEIVSLNLEKYITNPDFKLDDSKTLEKKSDSEKTNQTQISYVLYQYTRNSSMYLKEYIDIVHRLKKTKELFVYSQEYIQFVFNDLYNKKEEFDKEYNVLTHKILAELTSVGLITKKRFIQLGFVNIYLEIEKNIEECENSDEQLEILINNFKRMGVFIHKDKEVSKIIECILEWKKKKIFSGKLHFNLVDLTAEIEKWNNK